jgi:hypothetical protein
MSVINYCESNVTYQESCAHVNATSQCRLREPRSYFISISLIAGSHANFYDTIRIRR